MEGYGQPAHLFDEGLLRLGVQVGPQQSEMVLVQLLGTAACKLVPDILNLS